MATTYTTTGDWTGNIDSGIELAQQLPTGTTAPDGYIYKRTSYTVNRKRVAQELTAFTSTIGNVTSTGADIAFKSGTNTVTPADGQVYSCAKNSVNSVDGTDIWEEEDQWIHYSEWTEVRIDTMEA